jgi:hypothetical protein
LLIVAAALLKMLSKAAGSKPSSGTRDTSSSPKPDRVERPPERGSDEEQIRKFLEALGQPRTAKAPPPLSPRTDITPRPVAPVRPPQSLLTVPVPRTRKLAPAPERKLSPPRREVPPPLPPRKIYEPRPTLASMPPVPTFEVQETGAVSTESRVAPIVRTETAVQSVDANEQKPGDLGRLLRTPRGLRQAIILREIFGPPRSLQPMQDLPGTA